MPFDTWVVVPPRHLLRPRLLGEVVRDTFVEDVLREAGIEAVAAAPCVTEGFKYPLTLRSRSPPSEAPRRYSC